MIINNSFIGQWNELSIVAISVTSACLLAGFYRYAERYLVYKKPLIEAPIKFSFMGNVLIDLDADAVRFGSKRAEINRQRKQIEGGVSRKSGKIIGGGGGGGGDGGGGGEDIELFDIYENAATPNSRGTSPVRSSSGRYRGSDAQEAVGLLEGRVEQMDIKMVEIEHTVVDIITEVKKIKKYIAKKL